MKTMPGVVAGIMRVEYVFHRWQREKRITSPVFQNSTLDMLLQEVNKSLTFQLQSAKYFLVCSLNIP